MSYQGNVISATLSATANNQNAAYRLMLTFLLFALILVFPYDAFAGGGGGPSDPLTATICIVVQWFVGPIGRAIATLGIIIIAIGALIGKVSWGLTLTVTVGISIMFSGAQVVERLGVSGASTVCSGATGPDALELQYVLCNLANFMNGNAGRALGTLGIIFLGVGALMGKVSAGMALVLSGGIGAAFGAETVARQLFEATVTGITWPGCPLAGPVGP